MQSLVLIICLAFSFIVIGCGNHIWEKEDRGSNVASSETILDEESELPDFKLGECQGEFGCLRGFISHGMSLVIEPEVASDSVDRVDGEQVLLEAKVFRDAQDFGDRFDREFLLPLIPEDLRSNYTVSITPRVTRDNFAAGFELYSEGITAQDNRLSMEGEGNFTLGDILPYDRVALRAVKMFRIQIESVEGTESTARESYVTCLEISTTIPDLEVAEGSTTEIGGLSAFQFYYTEDNSFCQGVGTSRNQISAGKPSPVQPNIPGQ